MPMEKVKEQITAAACQIFSGPRRIANTKTTRDATDIQIQIFRR